MFAHTTQFHLVCKIKMLLLYRFLHLKESRLKELIRCFLFGIPPRSKYPEIVRRFCLNIYYLSVRAYECLRSTFDDNLPHSATVRSWYANSDLNCEPGISPSCLKILEKKAADKAKEGSKLLISICFDEMYIRKRFQWNNTAKYMEGFPTYGPGAEDSNRPKDVENKTDLSSLMLSEAANQVIVYMAIGINDNFKLPFAYHFVMSLNGEEKAKLMSSITDSMARIGVIVVNIVFDGCQSNKKMCSDLGANLKVGDPRFQPFFRDCHDHPIYILFDIPHMEKLVRGILSESKKLYDSDGNTIDWEYFESLVDLTHKEGFSLTHKMTQAHIKWKDQKMKVSLAVQTFSRSTMDSMEFLKNQGYL